MSRNVLIASGITVITTVFFAIAYIVFSVLNITMPDTRKFELYIQTESVQKVYDAEEISNFNWSITSGMLAEDHTLEFFMSSTITNPGSIENEIGITIFDEAGFDVTSNYNLIYDLGTLEVLHRELFVRTEGAQKVYDTTELVVREWSIQSGTLLNTHTLEHIMTASILTPGSITNDIGITILDEEGKDVTFVYQIDYDLGELEVFKRDLSVKTIGFEKIYDGEELFLPEWSLESGTLASNQVLYDVMSSKITTPGSIDNEVGITILGEYGNDVTEYYNIDYDFGILTVFPIELSIETEELEKYYDGDTLTSEEWVLVSGAVSTNHTLLWVMNSSITTPGSVINEIGITILDENSLDITQFYDIQYDLGSLIINARELTFETESLEKFYDSEPLTSEVWTLLRGAIFEEHSLEIVMNSSITNPGSISNEIGITILDQYNMDITEYYDIQYEIGNLTIHAIELIIQTETLEKFYDGEPLTSENYSILKGIISENHTMETVMISSITTPGIIENEIVVTIYDQNSNDVTEHYDIEYNIGDLTVNSLELDIQTETLEKIYDGLPLSSENFIILSGSIADSHSAEYVMTSTITAPGEITNDIIVTIYDVDGINVTDNYEITYDIGTLTVQGIVLSVETETTEKLYDGLPLTSDNYTILSGAISENHTLEVVMASSITIPGTIDNEIVITIYDQDLNNVTRHYNIEYIFGELTINSIELIIQTETTEKLFDGLPLTSDNYTILSGTISSNHTLEYNMNSSITIPGSIDNDIGILILDHNDQDITQYYEITYELGTLTIDSPVLEIQTETEDKLYDGTPLTSEIFTLLTGSLAENHSMDTVMISSITTPGTIVNEIGITIYDQFDNDVTRYYDIEYLLGDLTVNSVELVIQTESIEKFYDGVPITSESYTILEGVIPENHSLNYVMISSITTPGSIDNEIAITITDNIGNDITDFYIIDYDIGTLTVKYIELSIQTDNVEKNYDGTPLSSSDWSIFTGAVLEEHTIEFVMNSEITNPGSINNDIGITIFDEYDNDVTSYYDIDYQIGDLTVKSIIVVLQSESESKIYDGTSLSNNNWAILHGEILPTHTIHVSIDAEITDVGEMINNMFVYVTDEEDQNVTYFYNFTMNEGVLQIFSSSFSSSSLATGSVTPSDAEALNIFSNTDGSIYLRGNSYGNYEYFGWGNGFLHHKDISINPLNFGGISLEDSDKLIFDLQIEYLREQLPYLVPYFVMDDMGTLNDVYIYKDTSDIVNFSYTPYTYNSTTSHDLLNTDTAVDELLYRDFVYENYLELPESTREAFLDIASENGIDIFSDTLIEDIKNYIQNAAVYNSDMADVPNDVDDLAVYFLTVSKEGFCQHFATAATIMYRTMGIPARYTTGFVSQTVENEWVTVTNKTAHAWVEVYIDGFGWMPIEVTAGGAGGSSGGSGGSGGTPNDDSKPTIKVQPKGVIDIYEAGKTISPSEIYVINLTEFLAQGYTYEFTLEGELSEPGIGISNVSTFIIYDALGNDVSEEFDIVYSEGYLKLYLYEIDFFTSGSQKIYDGTSLEIDDWSFDGTLNTGDYIYEVEMTSSQLNVGISSNRAIVTIYDQNHNDVTDLYRINYIFGDLMVFPKSLTIESGTAIKIYDGTALTSDTYEITSGSLVDGDILEVTITGSQTGIGRSINTIDSIVIFNGETEVTFNYSIQIVLGKLTVNPE